MPRKNIEGVLLITYPPLRFRIGVAKLIQMSETREAADTYLFSPWLAWIRFVQKLCRSWGGPSGVTIWIAMDGCEGPDRLF